MSLENCFKSILTKLSCGATYLDGSAPIALNRQSTMLSALHAMKTVGRRKPIRLIWTEGKAIRHNVKFIIDSRDHSIGVIRAYGTQITEMRQIRNHIVHNNDSTRSKFREIVRRHYGAYRRGVTTGTLLTSTRLSNPIMLECYIRASRALIRDLSRG